MSKYHFLEGGSAKDPKTRYFQVFVGGKTVGDPFRTKEDAQAYIKLLEERDAKTARERSEDLER